MKATTSRFNKLADEWESQTRNISNLNRIAAHPLVQEIIKMGDVVIPLILKRIKHRPWFWFDALSELTKSDPITPEMHGDMQKMTEAWIKWGKDDRKEKKEQKK